MSLLTIRTTHSTACKHNVFCDGILFLVDYSVKFHYIKGNSNMLADALSQLPFDEEQKVYALPNHDKHNIQAITSSCQRVLNGDSVHV
jgi:hypothetical protein